MPMRVRVWLLTFVTFFMFVIVAWLMGTVAGDALTGLRTIRAAVLVLGGLASASVFRFLTTRWKGRLRSEKAATREDHLSATMKAAAKRLKASPKAAGPSVRKLPLVIVLGPRGSTKTTVVENSGLDLELLGGETHRGDAIVPTEGANVWYAQGTVFVEAGGALVDAPERWGALLAHTQPARLAAALGIERQAARAAVVCVGCDEFNQPGAGESVTALARKLRERLVEAAQTLGIQLPVYVLFTRADRLPYYDDFVRSLQRDEAAQALGATLPLVSASAALHADAEGARIEHHLGEMLHALALKRREFLGRERDATIQAGVYEFPRELDKIKTHLTRFLIELSRPSQLGKSPFLRGFYFTGVRALVTDDAGAAPPPVADPLDAPAMGATAVFDMASLQAAASAAAPVARRSRRVPDWAFLKPFFRDVLLPDEAARVTTTGGARVDVLRRGLLSVAAVLAVTWVGGMVVSFRGNRALTQRVEAAAVDIREANSDGSPIPSDDTLERLEALRVELASLRAHETEGRPLGLRWGLYRGEAVLAPGLQLYLQSFEAALGLPARQAILDQLAALPAEPTEAAEYGQTYDALKAYLILTDYPQESTVAFLPDAMLASWTAARSLDEDRAVLLRRQLDFFAEVIRDGNPVAGRTDDAIIASARTFLGQFGDADRFYQSMLADAATAGSELRLAVAVPGSADLIRNDVVIPAYFTLEGWVFVRDGLQNVDAFFSSEDWVLGGQVISSQDRQRLAQDLSNRFQADYVAAWQKFLQATTVLPFGGPADAARRLSRLSDGQSPLLQTLALASRNTRPQSDLFQPLHAVAPPEEEERLIGDWNQGYVGALANLQGSLDQVATSTGPARSGALGQASQSVRQAEQAVGALAQGFNGQPDGARVTGAAVRALLEAPIRRAEALVGALPSAELNGRGRQFCQDFNRLLSGYPFQAASPVNAVMDDVVAALRPGQSALWAFYQDALQSLIAPQGNRYVARPGADTSPNPAFVSFFNRAADASASLFDAQGAGPQVVFVLRPQTSDDLPEITVSVDGQTQTFTRTQAAARTFVWEGARARDARILGRLGGVVVPLIEVPDGPWALFRLFQLADWEDLGGSRYRLRWSVPGQSVAFTAELNLAAPAPIFDRAFLDGLSCVSTVAR